MSKFKLFDPSDHENLLYFWQCSKRHAECGYVAMSEYLYPSNIGLNPNKLKGLKGYELASALRQAADYLDELASFHEHSEDAARSVQFDEGGEK